MTDRLTRLPQVQVPVLRLEDALLVTVQGDLQDTSAERLQADVLRHVADDPTAAVIIEISAVEVVDSFLARVLAEIAAGAGLLAAQTIVVGMRPSVAITMVELGLSLPGVRTARDLQSSLSMLRESPASVHERGERGPNDTHQH